jgi:hypothetical protein
MNSQPISVKGKIVKVPMLMIDGSRILIKGRFLKMAELFDEYWLETKCLPDPPAMIEKLKLCADKPDIFAFEQRIPDVEPKYSFPLEWRNYAVLLLSSYENWLNNQIASATKRNIKASEKRGVIVRLSDYDEKYVQGIMSIYNESPIRQNRRFWHYGKKYSSVWEENATYKERSTYLGAYYQEEMIGYMKIVWDENSARIMQILSKMEFYEKRPNNALMAEAVKQCCARGIEYLLYEKYVYGKKDDNSLTDFKKKHGFIRMNVPRYFVPLSWKGRCSLKIGLHKSWKDKVPFWFTAQFIKLRTAWYLKNQGKGRIAQ